MGQAEKSTHKGAFSQIQRGVLGSYGSLAGVLEAEEKLY